MKKNLIGIGIVFILTIVAIYLITNYKTGTIKKELKDFAVKDTAAITRIFLADMQGNKVILDKISAGNWTVNGKDQARKDAIETLLYTIRNIEPYAPVPKAAYNNVVKQLSSVSVKVEIYNDEENIKTYYVGGNTPDNLATYMMLEGSSAPFAVHIPGFNGFLSTRYFTDATVWKSTSVFSYQPNEIASVRVEYPQHPEVSFEIRQVGDDQYSLTSLADNRQLPEFDTVAVKEYLLHFKNMNYEGVEGHLKQPFVDSVLASTPMHIITVKDIKGDTKQVKTYMKRPTREIVNEHGKKVEVDVDRMYGKISNYEKLVLLQYFAFDRILRPIDDFIKKKSVSK